MENCEAMTSSTHSFAYSYRLVKKCFLKNCKTSKCHNFLIFQPIFIRFSVFCSKIVTLSSEIKLNLVWISSLSIFVQNLISSSTPYVVSQGQVWIKSIQRFSLSRASEIYSVLTDGRTTRKHNASGTLRGRGIKKILKSLSTHPVSRMLYHFVRYGGFQVQEQVYTRVIASSFAILLEAPQVWRSKQ